MVPISAKRIEKPSGGGGGNKSETSKKQVEKSKSSSDRQFYFLCPECTFDTGDPSKLKSHLETVHKEFRVTNMDSFKMSAVNNLPAGGVTGNFFLNSLPEGHKQSNTMGARNVKDSILALRPNQ